MQDPAFIAAMRFGLGPRAGMLADAPPAAQLGGADDTLARFPGISTAEVLAARAELLAEMRTVTRGTPAARELRKTANRASNQATRAQAKVELSRAVTARADYRERLVRFWANHFTVRARNALNRPMITAYSDEAIRPHVTGRFSDMLRAAILHPAMILYLDQESSVGPNTTMGQRQERGLNENLARELMELHTLGVDGPYSQTDVRQLAKLLTGVTVNLQEGFVFDPRRAEPGAEVILGRSYGSDGRARIEDIHALLDDLAAHPATARHLAGKLAVHFVADTPPAGLVEDLTRVWIDSGGDLHAVSAALAGHPAALAAPLQKVRQPFEFITAALRALGVEAVEVQGWNTRLHREGFERPMALMGQPWQQPPGPDGWPEELAAWVTPLGLAARIDWAMQLPARLRRDLPDARAFVDMALPGLADDGLRRLVAQSETTSEGIGLLLASPQFNRR